MRISSVQASCLNIPVKISITGNPDTVGLVLALVHTHEGITGIGISRELEMTATRDAINRELAPFLLGKSPSSRKVVVARVV